MEQPHKRIIKAISLEIRHLLEGWYDAAGEFQAGDLEQRLNQIGVWRDKAPKPVEELSHLSDPDRKAREVIDAYLRYREETGVNRSEAVAEFIRESAYSWANRLFALRCLEARSLIDEVILQKEVYGNRSLVHHRFALKNPEACAGEDDGLFAVLFAVFTERAVELPFVFDPDSPAVSLRPSVPAIKRCIALLSGTASGKNQDPAADEIFEAPDALGWTYQFWNTEEKDRVFERLSTLKGFKIAGNDIISVTQLYTEPYMVKFLVQNSLGAIWMEMHTESKLFSGWEYYVSFADRAGCKKRPVKEITFFDPACGSGHFLVKAFDLLYEMYLEEGELTGPDEIAASILNHNLFGADIDDRAVQITRAVLLMRAREKAAELPGTSLQQFHDNIIATNIHLPETRDHLKQFLNRYPDDRPLAGAIEEVFDGLRNVQEIGTLAQIEEPIEKELKAIKRQSESWKKSGRQQPLFAEMRTAVQGDLPLEMESFEDWQTTVIDRLRSHFATEARSADRLQAFFGREAAKGISLFNLLSRRYDVVATNPPYMGSKNMGPELKRYVENRYRPGKRDLYAAFILRCLEMTSPSGKLAMVTQQSWMFLRSFVEMRAVDEDKLKDLGTGTFKGLLRDTTIETLAHLGPRAFAEISGEVVNIALFTLAKAVPSTEHRLTAFRLIGPKSPQKKDRLLRESIKAGCQ